MHKEYKRIVAGADKAVLFIHGFASTPNYFEPFIPLIPDSMSIYNVLLDGHGKLSSDFAKFSMEKWEEHVFNAADELAKNHKEIYVVGHSLGCLHAFEVAARNSKIKKLFLLAAPLKLRLKAKAYASVLRAFFNKFDTDDKLFLAFKHCYGVHYDKNLLHYLKWIPRLMELFAKMRQWRKNLLSVKTPSLAFHSAWDEFLSRKNKAMLEANPAFTMVELQNSAHCYYEEPDLLLLKDKLVEFIA